LDTFLEISIVGVGASLLIEVINRWLKLDSLKAKFLTLSMSVFAGGIYVAFNNTVWWTTMLQVLMVSSTVYAFFLKGKK